MGLEIFVDTVGVCNLEGQPQELLDVVNFDYVDIKFKLEFCLIQIKTHQMFKFKNQITFLSLCRDITNKVSDWSHQFGVTFKLDEEQKYVYSAKFLIKDFLDWYNKKL